MPEPLGCVTVTMQATKGPDTHALVSLSSVIWLWLTGFQRNKPPLRLLSLVLNLLLWSTELKSCEVFAKSFAWWGSHELDPPIYSLTISPKWQTRPYMSWPWKRNVTPSTTMRCENQSRWVNHQSLILTLKITYPTLWPKWPVVKRHQLVGNILYDIYDDRPKHWGKTSRSRPTDLEGTEEIRP